MRSPSEKYEELYIDLPDKSDFPPSRHVTRDDLISAERSLFRIRHDLVGKREALNARAGGIITPDGTSSPPVSSGDAGNSYKQQ